MRSTEYGGVGQSGYAAGRREHDYALERDIHVANAAFPRQFDEEILRGEIETDERWLGKGGATLR